MTRSSISDSSPKWGPTLKLIVGLTVMAFIIALLIKFRSIMGPLLLAFIVSYLLYPLARGFSKLTRLSWRGSVSVIFLVVVLIILGLSTATGVVVVQEVQNLIKTVQNFITDLPNLISTLSTQVYKIGPFTINVSQFLDLNTLGNELMGLLQGALSRAGTIVASFASSAVSTIGWGLFVLLVSFFILADIGNRPDPAQFISIPGFDSDVRRVARELGQIWNAFLRGQILIVSLVIVMYSVVLTILDVRYALGLALLMGLARFVPYVGPFITYAVTFLVIYFQGTSNFFGWQPLTHALIVIPVAIVLDQIVDSMISPRFFGQTLGVHPAAVLVAAIMAADLIGIVGVVLAAPVLATFKLVGTYITRKMLDLDPWPEKEKKSKPVEPLWLNKFRQRLQAWWKQRRAK